MKEVISILLITIVGLLSACDWHFQEPMPTGCEDKSAVNMHDFCSFSCDGCEDYQISDKVLTMKLRRDTIAGSTCTCAYILPAPQTFNLAFSRVRYSLILPLNMSANIYYIKTSNQYQCPNENCATIFNETNLKASHDYQIVKSILGTNGEYEKIVIELKNNCFTENCSDNAIFSMKDLIIYEGAAGDIPRFWF